MRLFRAAAIASVFIGAAIWLAAPASGETNGGTIKGTQDSRGSYRKHVDARGPVRDFFDWLLPGRRPPVPPPAVKEVVDWGHSAIGVSEAWKKLGTKGKEVVVAVLDTGCDVNHPDLKDRIFGGYDFTTAAISWYDGNGHGTHVAGIVAASENGSGMIGVAPECKLLIVKVLDDSGSGWDTSIANGIDFAAKHADVISMSLGGGYDSKIHAAVKRAVEKGVIVIVAAGNSGPQDDSVDYPGALDEVICVGATNIYGDVADFSSRGIQLDIAAPGEDVRSTYPGGRFATMSGTSMATPYVAGCAALFVSYRKALGLSHTTEDFRAAIQASALDLLPVGFDNDSGFGLIQPARLVNK